MKAIPGTSFAGSVWSWWGRNLDGIGLIITWLLFATVLVAATALLSGCVSHRPTTAPVPSWKALPSTLTAFNHGLDVLAILSVMIIGGAIALFLLVPTQHRLSTALGLGAGGILIVSLFLKVTLWLVPWIVGGLLVAAAITFAYEIYYKIKHGTFDKPGDGKGNL